MAIKEFSASVLAADPLRLHEQITKAARLGITSLHLDIMDNHYVNNLALSYDTVTSIAQQFSDLTCDVHLMVSNPEDAISKLPLHALRSVVFHASTSKNPLQTIQRIQKTCQAGVAINPNEDYSDIKNLLEQADYCLVMGVTPGRCGQAFQPQVLNQLQALNTEIRSKKLRCQICIDGGVNTVSIPSIIDQDIAIQTAVIGSALFHHIDHPETLQALLETV